MHISYEEIFKYSDVFNPLSPTTLLSAGKLAQLEPKETVLDLGSGKGFPSLLWASVFGVHVEGFDLFESYVEYTIARAKMLNLSGKVQYFCQDLKGYTFDKEYAVVASLGLDTALYGDRRKALTYFKNLLEKDGVLVVAEPVWLKKPVPTEALKALGVGEESFITLPEMQKLLQELGFQELGHFVSSKEDWELYVRPVYVALHEIIKEKRELASEAQGILDLFKAEFDAAGKFWDMVLWVLKTN
jgi:cyclopropane fatty-acyl-phospholipid synthase-like methyltransferase